MLAGGKLLFLNLGAPLLVQAGAQHEELELQKDHARMDTMGNSNDSRTAPANEAIRPISEAMGLSENIIVVPMCEARSSDGFRCVRSRGHDKMHETPHGSLFGHRDDPPASEAGSPAHTVTGAIRQPVATPESRGEGSTR